MIQDITVEELKKRQANNEELVIIDVREDWEYDEMNINAKNIPMGNLPQKLEELESLKEKEIILHCKSGRRSDQAKRYLMTQGFTQVRSLLGGIEAYLEEVKS
jgi:rhodanese-related sulfurtransferase